MKFIDDLAGAIYDVLRFILRSVSYILTGMIIVAIPMYVFVYFFEKLQ